MEKEERDLRTDAHAAGLGAVVAIPEAKTSEKIIAAVDAVLDMLGPIDHHELRLDEHGFTLTHPLTERHAGTMHECEAHVWASENGSVRLPGLYRMTPNPPKPHDPTSESFRSERSYTETWNLERIE